MRRFRLCRGGRGGWRGCRYKRIQTGHNLSLDRFKPRITQTHAQIVEIRFIRFQTIGNAHHRTGQRRRFVRRLHAGIVAGLGFGLGVVIRTDQYPRRWV